VNRTNEYSIRMFCDEYVMLIKKKTSTLIASVTNW